MFFIYFIFYFFAAYMARTKCPTLILEEIVTQSNNFDFNFYKLEKKQ